MRLRGLRGLLGLLLVASCTAGAPGAPAAVEATRDPILAGAAPGDTLRYTLSWTAAARATGYTVTTTVVQGTGWSGLLTNAPTTGTSMAFVPVNATAWDSVRFSACVTATRTGTTKTGGPTCTAWTVIRSPGAPGPVAVDSSLVIAQVILKPDSAALTTLATQQFCVYFRALDGKVRLGSGYEALPVCQGYYDALPASDRLPGYPVALSHVPRAWMAGAGLRIAVRTPTLELAHLLFAGPFPALEG